MNRPTNPSRLIITEMHDERNRFDYYWERLRSLDVPTPRTAILPLETDGSRIPEWDTQQIKETLDGWGVSRGFVRTQHKAAPRRLREGSYIEKVDTDSIDRTVRSLLTQIEQSNWEHGGGLVLREWTDLRFCMSVSHDLCHPEIRYFIEDGDIIAETPSVDDVSFVCQQKYDFVEQELSSIDGSFPRQYAEKVAEEFSEDTWTVDFVMDTSGQWSCVEMGLNAVRWIPDENDWKNHCGHGTVEAVSPREAHSTAFRMTREETGW